MRKEPIKAENRATAMVTLPFIDVSFESFLVCLVVVEEVEVLGNGGQELEEARETWDENARDLYEWLSN